MIVLDTNVISELMKKNAEPSVLAWIAGADPGEFVTTSITRAEILLGVMLLPEGRRRSTLEIEARRILADFGSGGVLSFGEEAAEQFVTIVAHRRGTGRPIDPLDAQIAAIARAHRARLATRNVRDFEDCGVSLIDPWAA